MYTFVTDSIIDRIAFKTILFIFIHLRPSKYSYPNNLNLLFASISSYHYPRVNNWPSPENPFNPIHRTGIKFQCGRVQSLVNPVIMHRSVSRMSCVSLPITDNRRPASAYGARPHVIAFHMRTRCCVRVTVPSPGHFCTFYFATEFTRACHARYLSLSDCSSYTLQRKRRKWEW